MIYQKHCPGCYGQKNGVAICPFCGYDESAERSPLFLPHGVIIGGQYRVGRVLGRPGGFGITYIGWDVHLQQRVAIKEFLPRDQAGRQAPALDVIVHDEADKGPFEAGKEQFLREARIVAKLDHPNVVRVRNFFKDNGTAYLVMDYYEGMSLGDYLTNVRTQINAEIAVPLIRPIIEALEYVHERGVVHRDLKPHNIYLAAIGKPILLDFGAARQAAAGGRVHSLSVVLTEGYAPLEQYQRRASQGPHTDVYGAAATLYRMVTGVAPPIALDRLGQDEGAGLDYAMVPEALRPVLARGLAVRPQDRYATAAEFGADLDRWRTQAAAPPAEKKPAEAGPQAEGSRRAGERRQSDRSDFPRTELLAPDPDSVLTNPSPDDPETVMDTAAVRRWGLPVLASVAVLAIAATLIAKVDRDAAPARTYVAETVPSTSPAIRPTSPGAAAESSSSRASTPPPAAEFPVVAETPAPPPVVVDTGPPPAEPAMIVPPGARAAIGTTEVTVAEFALFVERTGYDNAAWLNYPCESAGGRLPDWENPGHEQAPEHPVVCVSRVDAQAYAAWLARATGKPYRLPTEAEWEYAARGGSSSAYWWGSGEAAGRAVCRGCIEGALNSPVAARMRPANPYGLYEIAGNVREWTCSAFEPPAPDRCASAGTGVVRGGSWHQGVETLRSSAREELDPQRRDVWTGFRLALGS